MVQPLRNAPRLSVVLPFPGIAVLNSTRTSFLEVVMNDDWLSDGWKVPDDVMSYFRGGGSKRLFLFRIRF
jgi:hypothetical protein